MFLVKDETINSIEKLAVRWCKQTLVLGISCYFVYTVLSMSSVFAQDEQKKTKRSLEDLLKKAEKAEAQLETGSDKKSVKRKKPKPKTPDSNADKNLESQKPGAQKIPAKVEKKDGQPEKETKNAGLKSTDDQIKQCSNTKLCRNAYEDARSAYDTANRDYCSNKEKEQRIAEICQEIEKTVIRCGVLYILRLTNRKGSEDRAWQTDDELYKEVKRVLVSTLVPTIDELFAQKDQNEVVDRIITWLGGTRTEKERKAFIKLLSDQISNRNSDLLYLLVKALEKLPEKKDREALVELLPTLCNPAAVDRLKGWLKSSKNPKLTAIGDRIDKEDYTKVIEGLKLLGEEELDQLYTFLYNERERRFGTGYSSKLLKVAFVGDVDSKRNKQFELILLKYLEIKFPQRLTRIEPPPQRNWTTYIKGQAKTCGNASEPGSQCDAILVVRFVDKKAIATVWSINDSEEKGYREGNEVSSDEIPDREVKHAVRRFFIQLGKEFSIFRGDSNLAMPEIDRIGPTLHPGVGIEILKEESAAEVAPALEEPLGLQIKGNCWINKIRKDDFKDAFASRIGKSYAERIGQVRTNSGEWPLLSLELDRQRAEACVASLRLGNEEENREVLQVAVTPFSDQDTDRGLAGDDLARVVGQFYQDAINEAPDKTLPIVALAVVSSGLPMALDKDNDYHGWGWALVVVDSLALLGGASMLLLAADLRNDYSEDRNKGKLDAASDLYTAGSISLAAGVGARLLGMLLYPLVD